MRAPQEIPPLGRVRWEYLLLDQLSHEQGNLFRLWYEDLEPYERSFWHSFMHKASLKQEYRWEDHCKQVPPQMEYQPVRDFDPRFFYYDHYQMITQDLFQPTSVRAEEAKCEDWAIVEEDLEPGLALDPNSYAAKARKRQEPPTEADVLSSVRKRPATPPQEGASVGSPTSAVTQGQAAASSSSGAARPTPERVTGAVSAISSQETTPGQSQPMEVSQTALPGQGMQQTAVAVDGTPSTTTVTRAVTPAQSQGDVSGQRPVQESQLRDQSSQGIESHSSQQQPSQDTAQVSATQPPAGQSNTQRMDHSDEPLGPKPSLFVICFLLFLLFLLFLFSLFF